MGDVDDDTYLFVAARDELANSVVRTMMMMMMATENLTRAMAMVTMVTMLVIMGSVKIQDHNDGVCGNGNNNRHRFRNRHSL